MSEEENAHKAKLPSAKRSEIRNQEAGSSVRRCAMPPSVERASRRLFRSVAPGVLERVSMAVDGGAVFKVE